MSGAYAKLPLYFEANQGQTDPQVKFLSRGSKQTLFLTSKEAVLVFAGRERPWNPKELDPKGRFEKPAEVSKTALRMSFLGANPDAEVTGQAELPSKASYFVGNDRANWRTNVPTYARVRYQNLYPGIDLEYYGTQRQLEYDLVVRPGADLSRIAVRIQGADQLEVDGQGDLLMHTGAETIQQRKPIIYQEVGGRRIQIPGAYLLKGRQEVAFEVSAYDKGRPLVIDPVLLYSTYLGGTGFETGFGIAVDASGSAYVTGVTVSVDFPTLGAFQSAFGGPADAFVTKLNPTGSALVYSTYLGGSSRSGFGDEGFSIAVDASGSAYVRGNTESTNFPTTPGAFDTTANGGLDAFVTKLDPTGAALVYSTHLGGSSNERGSGIAVDASGNAYVTGLTNSTNFPTTPGAFQTTVMGVGGDTVFVTKLNPTGSALAYSTYLGRCGLDEGFSIAVDGSGNAYVTGQAGCNFPTTPGAFDTTSNSVDAFVTKLDPTGAALVYSTYLGGSGGERGLGIAVDASGNAYVTGFTAAANFPTTPGAFQRAFGGGFEDAFVTKVNPTGSALVYSTYVGGSRTEAGFGIAVDASGNAYVTGITDSTNFPTTPGAFQRAFGGGFGDAFVTKLNPTGSALVYSTYFGGSGVELGFGIAADTVGSAYATGGTDSANFPTTPGAFDTAANGRRDAFVVKVGSGYEIVSHQVFVPASTTANVNVACSSGNKVLGGGFSIETPDFVRVFSSEPSDGLGNLSDHQWNVLAQNMDPNNALQVTSVAVCASALQIGGHEIVSQLVAVPASNAANTTVACSSGNKVLGGGFSIDSAVRVFSSEPSDGLGAFSDHHWNVLVQNTNPNSAQQTTAIAVCAPATQIPGHEIVFQQGFVPASTPSANVNVACSSGKKVLGGGFSIESLFVGLFESVPSDGLSTFSDHRWNVEVQNTDTGNARQVTASAVCAQLQ